MLVKFDLNRWECLRKDFFLENFFLSEYLYIFNKTEIELRKYS